MPGLRQQRCLIVCPLRTAAAAVCLRHAITAEPHPPPLTSCNVYYITPSRAGLLSVPQHPAHMPHVPQPAGPAGSGLQGGCPQHGLHSNGTSSSCPAYDKLLAHSMSSLPHRCAPLPAHHPHCLQDGMCIVTSQVLTVPAGDPRSCRASKASTAVLLRFPCKEEPRLKQASGPALNVWGSFDGIPQPTKHGMIVTESAPVKTAAAQPRRAAKLIDSRADGYVVSSSGSHNPGGYVVSGSGSSTPSGYVVSSSSNPNGYVVSSTGAGSSSSSPAGPIVIATNNAGTSDGYVVSSAGANTPAGYVVSTTDANAPAGYVVSTTDAKAPAGYVVSSNGGNAPAGYVVSTAGVNSSVTSSGACSFLTLNPGLYYHKSPPMFTYGYVVSGVPCDRAASALAATTELNKAGAKTFPTTYSLWLKPSLPAVSGCVYVLGLFGGVSHLQWRSPTATVALAVCNACVSHREAERLPALCVFTYAT